MTAAPTRRIRVDVQISGGRVRLDLTAPTDEQLAAINRLLEEWLDDDESESASQEALDEHRPATQADPQPGDAEPEPEPARSERPARVSCGVLHDDTGHRCRRGAGHDGAHGWWGRGSRSHQWTDSQLQDDVAVQLGDAAALGDQITEHAATSDRTPPPAGVILCRCSHGERMHERDELVGRGQCHHSGCGCAEYQAAA